MSASLSGLGTAFNIVKDAKDELEEQGESGPAILILIANPHLLFSMAWKLIED